MMKTLLVLLLMLLAGCCGLPGWGFGPREALAYRSKEALAIEEKLRAMRVVERWARYGTTGTMSSDTQRDSKQSYSLRLRLAPDRLNILENRHTLDATGRELAQQVRTDAATALLAHATLWEAQAADDTARARAALTQLLAKEAERKFALGAIPATDRELARLDADDAALAQRQAAKALVTAKADALRLALTDDAAPDVAAFTLPGSTIEQTPAYKEAVWTKQLALERAAQSKRDVKPALVLEALHLGNTQVSGSLSTRGPSADVLVGYPTLTDPTFLLYQLGWTFTVRAEIPIDPVGWAKLRLTRADAALAEQRLATQRGETQVQIPVAKREAETAAEELALARERLTLLRRKLEIVTTKADDGAASAVEVQNAAIARGDAEAGQARAWKRYITAVAKYLDLVDGTWEVAP